MDTVTTCLKEADSRHMSSIAFPPLGAGYLGYTPDIVADVMFDAIETFSSSSKYLDTVYCVIYQKDRTLYDVCTFHS